MRPVKPAGRPPQTGRPFTLHGPGAPANRGPAAVLCRLAAAAKRPDHHTRVPWFGNRQIIPVK